MDCNRVSFNTLKKLVASLTYDSNGNATVPNLTPTNADIVSATVPNGQYTIPSPMTSANIWRIHGMVQNGATTTVYIGTIETTIWYYDKQTQ